jgi:dihydroflavonol-4-reductase
MKVLITGADGLLGNNLARELLSRNHEVSALLLDEQLPALGLKDLPIRRYFGNILDKSAVSNAVAGHDLVVHAAASTQIYPARDPVIRQVNITGTAHVIDACLEHNVSRLIHVGTANSFAPGCKQQPGDENGAYTGLKYGLDYKDSKYEAQKLIQQAVANRGLNAVIVNPTFMIGPFDTKPSSGALILALYQKKVPLYTPGSRTYVAVKDAAIAIANAFTAGKAGECFILGNQSLSYKEAFDIITETIGVAAPKFSLPSQMIKMFGMYSSWYASFSGKSPVVTKEMALLSCTHHCYTGEKARQQLGMPCTELHIAVKECFDWFQQNGYVTN